MWALKVDEKTHSEEKNVPVIFKTLWNKINLSILFI